MSENMGSGEVERKIYLLDDENCDPCAKLKKDLVTEIAAGKVEVLQVTSDQALELLEQAGAPEKVEFPSALVKDEKGVRFCQIYHSQDITLSKCGDDIIAIREPPEEQPASRQPEPQTPPPNG
jgi:hypothetical protein